MRRGVVVSLADDEVLDLVDAGDNVVGQATLKDCLHDGLLHRAVAVLVSRPNGRFVLQQRSRQDRWHPGLWTISCTGHVRRGESYEVGAVRETMEELGLHTKPTLVKKYLLPPITSGSLTEHEWVALFATVTDSKISVDPVELEGVNELTKEQLLKMVEFGPLTPDARAILGDYLGISPRTSKDS